MEQAQKFIDEKKKDIPELVVGSKNLNEYLKIERFTELKRLYCHNNKITRLEIVNCSNIETRNCRDNQLNKQLIKKINEQSKRQELLNSENSNPSQTLQNIRQRLEIYFPSQLLSADELVEKA